MATSSNRANATTWSTAPRSHAPAAGHCQPLPLQETHKHSRVGLAQSLWGLLVHKRFCLSPPSISGGHGVWFFHTPSHLAVTSPCPWTWSISFWWDTTFSYGWLFSSELQFWSSFRKRWVHILLSYHLQMEQLVWKHNAKVLLPDFFALAVFFSKIDHNCFFSIQRWLQVQILWQKESLRARWPGADCLFLNSFVLPSTWQNDRYWYSMKRCSTGNVKFTKSCSF